MKFANRSDYHTDRIQKKYNVYNIENLRILCRAAALGVELVELVNTTPTTIGRYERDEVKPSIEVAAKIADVLDVSLDYLIGRSDNYIRDNKVLNRINDILSLNDPDKAMILNTLDALLRDAKTRKAYSS